MTDRGSIEDVSLRKWVFQDWAVNAGYRDSQLILAWFRLAQRANAKGGVLNRQFCTFYRLFTSMFMAIELPAEATVGPRLRVYHPHSIVLNPGVVLGADCVLRQNVTIGNVQRRNGTDKGVASAGDDVEFGAGCVVVGPIHVGDHARIAALALVVEDVPANGVMKGNPAVLVRINDRPPQAPVVPVGGAA